jgi:hydroxymethylbilane synthase
MSPRPARLVIATRQSRLALWQSNFVSQQLSALYPERQIELLPLSTRGDEVLDRSLAAIGGKGLFVKELEQALADGRADLAVHSCKDVPMDLPEGFTLAAYMEREDPRDAFVSVRFDSLAALPQRGVVGTSSLRREAQLRHTHPHLQVNPLRGNIDTRLRKLEAGTYDALVLAAAGLRRLGLEAHVRSRMSVEESVPAVGQGALAIEVRAERGDLADLLKPLNHSATERCVRAERAASRGLGGSCHLPLAVHGRLEGREIRLTGLVATQDGSQLVRATLSGDAREPERLGAQLAAELRSRGAEAILEQLPTQ